MNVEDYRRIVANFTRDDVHSVQLYVSGRCELRGLDYEEVVFHMLNPVSLAKIVKDRKGVYKLYFQISKHLQIEVFAEINRGWILIRSVTKLKDKFKTKSITNRRF